MARDMGWDGERGAHFDAKHCRFTQSNVVPLRN